MGVIALVALGVLVGVLVFNSNEARPQPLPTQAETTAPDCGCGVPASPRGPR
jgi:hypothetical protein